MDSTRSWKFEVRSWKLVLCALLALGIIVPVRASSTDTAVLKRITSRVDDRAGVIAIEASDPVPYVASQPDPRTFVVEMRDVLAVGFADNFTVDPRVPIAGIHVENSRAFDGASIARVSFDLAQPIWPRVRSSRNVIYGEADRLDRAAAGVIGAVGPASVIRDLHVERRGASTAITLQATGRLVTTNIEESKDGPARLYVDLANATSALPGVTPVGQGTVQNVRIGLNEKSAMLTRVAVEMSRRSAYHLEPSADGQQLTMVIDDAAPPSQQARAAAVLRTPSAPAAAQQPVAVMAQAQAPPGNVFAPPPQVPAQTPLPTPAPGTPTTQIAAPSRYTGNPVSLDFQGADLRAVLRTFAEISGLNIVIDPTIQGTVDVSLRDVPWDQALDIILRANKLGYIVDGTIVRIAPLSVLADEESQRRKLGDEQALAGELRVMTRTLSYAKGEELQALLTKSALSQRGTVQVDPRTNTIIVTDLADRLSMAADLITTLDKPQPQVEIEARIVQANKNYTRALGVQWGFLGRVDPALGNTTNMAFPNSGSLGGRTGAAQGPTGNTAAAQPTGVNLGVPGAPSAVGLALGSVNGAFNLDVALTALETSGNLRVLSTPRVSTQNNGEAEITQGV